MGEILLDKEHPIISSKKQLWINFKPYIKEEQHIRVPHQHPNHISHKKQQSTCQHPKVSNQSQFCTFILNHMKIITPQGQQPQKWNSRYYCKGVLERIHLEWIILFLMHRFFSWLQTPYRLLSSTLSNMKRLQEYS